MANPQSRLHVEGPDDYHALRHLLSGRQLDPEASWFPEIKEADGIDNLLKGIEVAVKAGTGGAVGFVLDANAAPDRRWQAVADHLGQTGLAPPVELPAEGYIDFSESLQTRVGVWLMPDNRRPGALEDFLLDLVDPADRLLAHARDATQRARALGAAFPDRAVRKAELRTWLAWGEEPGLPYGTALQAGYFGQRSPAAEAFRSWFGDLFDAAEAA